MDLFWLKIFIQKNAIQKCPGNDDQSQLASLSYKKFQLVARAHYEDGLLFIQEDRSGRREKRDMSIFD